MANQKSSSKISRLAFDLFEKQASLKAFETRVAIAKNEFEIEAAKVCEKEDCLEFLVVNPTESKVNEIKYLKVKKSQRAKVVFDVEKLEASVPKELKNKVFNKTMNVNDILGLANYVKELGGDQNTFKSFISVYKSVDVAEVERLEGIGKISSDIIRDCCSVTLGDATYKITKASENDVYGENN